MTDGPDPTPPPPYGSGAWQPPPPVPPHPGVPGYVGPYAAYGHPAPFGVHPISGIPYSDKSKATAGLLQLLLPFVSVCGVGRLYAGHTAIGLVQLLGIFVSWFLILFIIGIPLLIGIWLWSVIDGIVILASDSKDANGRLLR